MRKFLFFFALAAFFPASSAPTAAGEDAAPAANFVLIGWDGAQRAHVKELLAAGKLPNLARLIKEGGLAETRVGTGTTQTKPGWAEILTGVAAARFKIMSNNEYRPIPPGYTVFERLKARFGEGVATVFIAGKRYNLGARGPHEICLNAYTRDPATMTQAHYLDKALFKGKTRDGKPPEWVRREGEPYFYAVKAVDFHYAADSPDGTVVKKAVEALKKFKKKPFFAFVHFREPDEEGHLYGENSPEYGEALVRLDGRLGEISETLKRLGLYSKTAVAVTSDHGFDEGERIHRHAPYMIFAANRAVVPREGDRKDVTPTVLDWFGFDPGKLYPRAEGRSLFKK
ncbi:MAG: hypothetical protein A3J79_05680 [Elusimicrobia bacterium RIFOXYB2_FULL_62_6]|nr:MAG: hypothetical protein A3J79_05680 [Elusimicrobia bacterium RIFOXYB2_FULL_62_6]